MFDAETARLLRSAPGVPGLDPEDIPGLLTRHYANLVSARLRGAERDAAAAGDTEGWPLERIADTYELITSVHTDPELRRASAFVAATAQQILARRQVPLGDEDSLPWNVDRDRVDPTLAAALLFLAAEQYADAHEATSAIRSNRPGQLYEVTILSENIADLARGQLDRVVERGGRWRRPRRYQDLEEQALAALLETLIAGIEILAADFLNLPVPEASADRFDGPSQAFTRVLNLSSEIDVEHVADLGGEMLNAYAGPYHLAALLLAAYDGIKDAALTKVPPPAGAAPEFWGQWLRYRAKNFPFVWPNHRAAIAQEFHQTGNSAVVILPTGAGKTTVSSLKIAGVLARGQKVIFLAPTHALVEQLTDDLQEMFPEDLLGSVVSSDFDLLFQTDVQIQEIEVMTPERCLATLSFAPEAFANVGLLVFDECHLLGAQPDKIRRALDGMLCVLGFNHIAPDADMLFLSAMLKNGEEFARWVAELTARPSVCVDLLWKPSRQARGVIIYKEEELREAVEAATAAQRKGDEAKKKRAKTLRAAAIKELRATPCAIWGLQHNWLQGKKAHCIVTKILDGPVALAGSYRYGAIWPTPNSNRVAADLAVAAARNGLKSIVFVNTKQTAISTAEEISRQLGEEVEVSESEQEKWDALEAELGDLKHAVLPGPAIAVPHNSAMLRLERDLAERTFRRQNGAKVIVATPTLAQGLNLPAHLAILAGDKRADADDGGREDLEAHEILNAAARAGRAGHLANGVVLLIPEPIISFGDNKKLSKEMKAKLTAILPEDDHCVVISDPLEIVLDRLMQGEAGDIDVRYVINRMAALREAEGVEEPTLLFNLRKSFGAYAARRKAEQQEFDAKVDRLRQAIAEGTPVGVDEAIAILASQSGLSMDVLSRLRERVLEGLGSLPTTVEDWLIWTVEWLKVDEDARLAMLYDVKGAILGATGRKKDSDFIPDVLSDLLPGLRAWINGSPLADLEAQLGGEPNSTTATKRVCPRARELIGSVIPRGFSFIIGLVSHVVEDAEPFEAQEDLTPQLVECLGACVRKGFESPEKMFFADEHRNIIGRVQAHQAWAKEWS